MKLHLGCGRDIREGWVNVDSVPGHGVDILQDLDNIRPFDMVGNGIERNSVTEFYASHLVEHLQRPLEFMYEMWLVAVPGAKMTLRTPHGASDDAWEDPTHHRPWFPYSFSYFEQPTYWKADYGYRGDWKLEVVKLLVDKKKHVGQGSAEVMAQIRCLRNVVIEMEAVLTAIKPVRAQRMELRSSPAIEVWLADVGGPNMPVRLA